MAEKSLKKGVFITLEGVEGCGKTTHAKLLCGYLAECGFDCVFTREPGGTKLGESVRRVLLDSDGVVISSLAELFLFEAARAQVVCEVIRPNLAKKRIVVCDRFYDATLAYQGYAGGVDLKVIRSLNGVATGLLKPDLTILLDIDTSEGLLRASSKGVDRMEKKDIEYHKKVRRGYLDLAKKEPSRFRVIKVAGTIEDTQKLARREIDRVIQGYKRAG